MPFITRLPALTGADPYPDALLALDFVGARRGPQYYKALGVTTADITKIPGWTYTGGASTGSYAAKADGSLQLFAQNVPRITDVGYWAEEARTNLLTYSQQFDNADWTKAGSTVSADATTAPDGTTTADKINEDTSTGLHRVYEQKTKAASAITYTMSMYAKAAERSQVRITIDDAAGSDVGATFNISSGTIVTAAAATGTFSAASATITAAANGYYFITVTGTSNTATAVRSQAQIAVAGAVSYAGTAGSGIYIWQADLQAGAFATSPIPTTSVAVTRAAGVGSNPWTTNSGTLFAEFVCPPIDAANSQGIVSLDDGTASNRIVVYYSTGGSVIAQIDTGGVSQATLNLGAVTPGTRNKVAVRLATNDAAASLNGGVVATDASVTLPTVTTHNVGSSPSMRSMNAAFRRDAFYPRAFANSELQAITTAGAY